MMVTRSSAHAVLRRLVLIQHRLRLAHHPLEVAATLLQEAAASPIPFEI